jgi:1,2-diacylglycerol 3-beta-galactosyltransferase
MARADFFIGKPGPGSISEALQFHLPVIVECNGRTLPQERYNAQWVTEKRVGIVLKNFRQINTGVEQLLEPSAFAEFRANAGAYNNRALFEIPEFLEEILERNHSGTAGLGVPVSTTTNQKRTTLTPPLESSFAK